MGFCEVSVLLLEHLVPTVKNRSKTSPMGFGMSISGWCHFGPSKLSACPKPGEDNGKSHSFQQTLCQVILDL